MIALDKWVLIIILMIFLKMYLNNTRKIAIMMSIQGYYIVQTPSRCTKKKCFL
jgi:hypothetical protein